MRKTSNKNVTYSTRDSHAETDAVLTWKKLEPSIIFRKLNNLIRHLYVIK